MDHKQYPLESEESIALTDWCNAMRLKNGHVPNETPTKKKEVGEDGKISWIGGWKTNSRNKRMGVARGFPDHIVIIPKERSIEERALLFFIEMKRAHKSVSRVSPEQIEWLNALDQVSDVCAFVAYGAGHAIEVISKYIAR